ncbi:MAG: hypothetical protein K0U68_02190 [Gammaproteobacteria bacterium]|nr:hypothetical protein [Gammaproteobacteria bacterium]
MQSKKRSNDSLTAEAAKNLVFDHWNFLSSLARKRFPNDSDMADQALSYVLDKLEDQNWNRVRGWDGCGSFATFVAVLASRLMTDFVRSKFGYHRPPAWLQEKKEVIWQKAYKLYAVDKYERKEAIEVLLSDASIEDNISVEDVVNTVYAKCTKQARFSEGNVGIDQIAETASSEDAMPENIDVDQKQLIEVLIEYIESNDNSLDVIKDETVRNLLYHLKSQIDLSHEDRLLLRLRYCEGLKVKEISQMLHLNGNLYKRINNLIDELKAACQQCGLIAA